MPCKMHSPPNDACFKKEVEVDRAGGDRGPGAAPAGSWCHRAFG